MSLTCVSAAVHRSRPGERQPNGEHAHSGRSWRILWGGGTAEVDLSAPDHSASQLQSAEAEVSPEAELVSAQATPETRRWIQLWRGTRGGGGPPEGRTSTSARSTGRTRAAESPPKSRLSATGLFSAAGYQTEWRAPRLLTLHVPTAAAAHVAAPAARLPCPLGACWPLNARFRLHASGRRRTAALRCGSRPGALARRGRRSSP